MLVAYAEASVSIGDVTEIYRVRVCKRCGHAACPCCNGSWCDACFDRSDNPEYRASPDDDFNAQCADAQQCVYDESASEAVVLLRTETRAK